MKMRIIGAAAFAAAALGMSTAAQAQDTEAAAHPYVGVQVGYHNLGVDDDDVAPLDVDDTALIYGAYVGFDFNVGSNMVLGLEGNFNLGTSAIDSEYGAAARIGFRAGGGTIVYARAGYQWVDLDVSNFTGVPNPPAGIEDTVDDYLVGVGADIALGNGPARFRVGVDTISFDTLRATAGLNFVF